MMILPAIDLKDGRCVRLAQGRLSEVRVYDADPVEVAKTFAADGAEMLHLVDLDGAFEGGRSANRKIVERIIENVDVPVEFGGGVRTIDDVRQLLDLGVAQVIVGTLAAESGELLASMLKEFGSRICVGIDARDGMTMTRGWEQPTKVSAVTHACAVAALGVERVIYTDIARDGMLTGINVEQTCEIARKAKIHVTASGGVSSLQDITKLQNANEPLVDGVIIGKALYEGKFTLAQAIEVGLRDECLN